MENQGVCPVCGNELKLVPAGVSKKTGRSYNAFTACSNRVCTYKPSSNFKREPKMVQDQRIISAGVKTAQENKDESIRVSSTARDATLLVTTFPPQLNGMTEEDAIKESWLKWRNWLWNRWNDPQRPDEPPF